VKGSFLSRCCAVQQEIKEERGYRNALHWALTLSSIGETLNVYTSHQTAFYIAIQELNYGFTHEEMLLVSSLLRMHGKELLYTPVFETYRTLLPRESTLRWLSFIYTLTLFLHEYSPIASIDFSYQKGTLTIRSDAPLYLAKEKIRKLEKPIPFAILIEDRSPLPKNNALGI